MASKATYGMILSAAICAASMVAGAGNTCVWNGSAGDGRLETPGNWNIAPVSGNGDTLEIDIGDTPTTIRNDTEDFSVACIKMVGTNNKLLTLTGERIRIAPPDGSTDTTVCWSNHCSVVVDVPLRIYGNCMFQLNGTSNIFNKAIHVANGDDSAVAWRIKGRRGSAKDSYLGTAVNIFRGDICGPRTALYLQMGINGAQSWVDFYGKVEVDALYHSESYLGSRAKFHSANNEIAKVTYVGYPIWAMVDNVLTTNTVIDMTSCRYAGNGSGFIFLGGTSQIANRLSMDTASYWYTYFYDTITSNDALLCLGSRSAYNATYTSAASSAATLTLKGTANAITRLRLTDVLSATWDPVGNFTQDFHDRKHSTSGTLTVKGGTMRTSGTTVFENVPRVRVGGGAFDVSSTTATVFPNLDRLDIVSGGRFIVTNSAVTALTAGRASAFIANGGKFVLANDVTLDFDFIRHDGAVLAADTYTAANCGWIEGAGSVIVRSATPTTQERYFTGATDSRWNDASNWSTGTLPANDIATYITSASGATVPSGDDIIYNLASFPGAANDTTPTFAVEYGGKVAVTGGSLIITNITGKARVGGDDLSATSRIDVTSGFLGMYASRSDSFAIGKGGLLSMSGGTAWYQYNNSNGWRFRMSGGALDLSGDAEFNINVQGYSGMAFGTGTVGVRGNAIVRFPSNAGYVNITPDAPYQTLTLYFSGDSKFESGLAVEKFGGSYTGATTVVNASGNAKLWFGGAKFGYGGKPGASCELNISEYAIVSNKNGLVIGTGGTAEAPSLGRVKITGGILRSDGANGASFIVGDDSATVMTGIYNRATLEISSGAVSNAVNAYSRTFTVGQGNSYGEVLQRGGIIAQGYGDSRIGYNGGMGLYRFTGGTADFSKCALYIGSNGGKGVLEIGAGTGTFTAKSMNLADDGATLKFKLGADGSLATLGVSSAFTIGSGAKLEVDASAYTGRQSRFKLMTASSHTGTFAESDVSVTMPPGSHLATRLGWRGNDLMFIIQRGFITSFR